MPGNKTWRAEPVAAEATYPMRQQLLRAHQALDNMGVPGDHDADAGHFAVSAGGRIVGVATVLHHPPPEVVATAAAARTDPPLDAGNWWRLRGMAVAEECRHRGVGTALIAAARDHVAAHDGRALWCNARLPAVAFYRTMGFVTAGEPWEEPAIGPHITMWRPLDPPR
jgi:GNAT superfamily N-acetyltransferase